MPSRKEIPQKNSQTFKTSSYMTAGRGLFFGTKNPLRNTRVCNYAMSFGAIGVRRGLTGIVWQYEGGERETMNGIGPGHSFDSLMKLLPSLCIVYVSGMPAGACPFESDICYRGQCAGSLLDGRCAYSIRPIYNSERRLKRSIIDSLLLPRRTPA